MAAAGKNTVPVANNSKYAREYRARTVANGYCGWICGRKRNKYKWLCDKCAAKHREKQREKARRQ